MTTGKKNPADKEQRERSCAKQLLTNNMPTNNFQANDSYYSGINPKLSGTKQPHPRRTKGNPPKIERHERPTADRSDDSAKCQETQDQPACHLN